MLRKIVYNIPMFKLNCIKCKKPYESEENDPYLCDECDAKRLQLAKEIDAKVGSTVGQRPNNAWERIQAIKQATGKSVKGMTFINLKDL